MLTVVIPVLNECATIRCLVQRIKQSSLVSEVVVVDDGSIDGTPELAASAGARVITSSFLGKGASMLDGALAAENEHLLFMDGDLSEFAYDLVHRMSRPLMSDQADFVKARFTRSAGRVTQLSAKPLLQTFFPELESIDQPLGGIIATRRSLLTTMALENDYGVDVGLLLDMQAAGVRIEQVDIGYLEHDCQPLERLSRMANQVVRTILDRARRYGRFNESQLLSVREHERLSGCKLQDILLRLDSPRQLALIDMDGTLIKARFVEELSKRTSLESGLDVLLDNDNLAAEERTSRIASLFAGVSQTTFQDVAMNLPLTDGAVELVVGLRKLGYAVGIVSDSFYIATEVIRRRVFADFSLAHMLEFDCGTATGSVKISPPMLHPYGCQQHSICKENVLHHLADLGSGPQTIIAIGDNDGDACMLRKADIGIAFEPKTRNVARCADYVVEGNIAQALEKGAARFSPDMLAP